MSWIDAAASPQGKASLRGSAKKSSAGNLAGGGNRRPLTGEMTFMNVTASSEGAGSDEEMKNRIARRKAVERTRKRAADMQALALQEEKSAREKKNKVRNRTKVAIRESRAQEIAAKVLRNRSEQIQQKVNMNAQSIRLIRLLKTFSLFRIFYFFFCFLLPHIFT